MKLLPLGSVYRWLYIRGPQTFCLVDLLPTLFLALIALIIIDQLQIRFCKLMLGTYLKFQRFKFL